VRNASARLITLCTGNAARSVMAAYMLEHWGRRLGVSLEVVSAGTHVVEGQPMGMRTRAALASIPELGELPVARHRSTQLSPAEVAKADLIVAMEADHVRFVRRHHPDAADRCATLRQLCIVLDGPGDTPGSGLGRLHLEGLPLDPSEDVADPAGGDVEVYVACAHELWSLTEQLARRLSARLSRAGLS
jgi:protein-tyrosine-phosphatase